MTIDTSDQPGGEAHPGTAVPEYDTARVRAQAAITNGVARIVDRTDGSAGFVSTPMYDGDPWPARHPRPEPAIRAAALLRSTAEAVLHRHIIAARAAGTPWARIAHLLGIRAHDNDMSPAEQAFLLVAPYRPGSCHLSTTSWRCATCRELVTDSGPFESHPSDNESGHASGCVRHQANIQTYERSRDTW